MRLRAIATTCLLLVFIALTNFTVLADNKLSLTIKSIGEIIISVDPSLHQEFGLAYPVTYKFNIPPGSTGLVAYEKHQEGESWIPLPQKTPSDYFNGEEVIRFDYAANAAYVSVAFDSTSDDIFLRITDQIGQPVTIAFQNICRYYDNRQATVTVTADDWKEYTNLEFLQAVHTFRSYRVPITTAIITGGCTTNTWQTIQQELDLGYVEAASHTRSHVDPPYPDPVSEIIGSKEDILANLVMPRYFRRGSQGYVLTFIHPFGSTTSETEAIIGQAHYLINRYVSASTGNFTAWDPSLGKYLGDGKSLELGILYGGISDVNVLNSRFDESLANGTIYHILIHPHDLAATDEWSKGYIQGHLSYISNRKDIWYVNFGPLYEYHLLQDDAPGALQVVGGPPVIVTQPAGTSATIGESASFSVTASGSAPLTYQWQRNGADIPGASGALYTTPLLMEADSGAIFRCLISNSIGSVTSSEAMLSVSFQVANALANGSFESGTTSWNFYTNGSGSFSQASIGSSGAKSADLSINTEGTNVQLYQAPLTLQPNTAYRLTFDAYSNTGHDLEVNLGEHVSPYLNYGLSSHRFDIATSWQSFSIDFTSSGFSNPVSDGRLMFWFAPYAAAGDQYYIDNVVLARVADLVPPVVSPQIILQPAAQTVLAGQSATFNLNVSGTIPLAYQWQKNNVDITGATNSSYTTPATTAADSGALYRCRVTNSGGSVTSANAQLTVITPRPAKITVQPRDTTVLEGHTANFSVNATGDAPLAYQWQKNGVNVAGATMSSYSLASAARTDSGDAFRCIVSNAVGKDTSTGAILKVLGIPPTITVNPVTQIVTAPQTATFAVTASGTQPLLYQWQRDSVNIAGATDSAYITTATSSADSGAIFRCVVKNVAGAATSGGARLTVITPRPAKIALAPHDTTVPEGRPASFTIVASGDAPISYQWQKNGTDIPGANGVTCTITGASRPDSGVAYRCIATNVVGKDTSSSAFLHVLPIPPTITLQPLTQTVNFGQTATFSVKATGSWPLSYQWQKDTVNIIGAKDSTYGTPAAVTADSGTSYRCVVSNAAGSTVSAAARLTVITPYPPVVSLAPHDTTVQEGHTAHFGVAAVGTAPLSYQWQKNDVDINGATGASYGISSAARPDSGSAFRCIVSNAVGRDTSKAGLLHVLPVPPIITTQPIAKTVDVGHPATFSVIAAGSAPLTYQWQKDTISIAGSTDSSYTTPNTATTDSGAVFRCVVTNAAGAATSVGARLTVITPYPPVVIMAPRDTAVQEGQSARFTVLVSGTAPFTYQWQKNGSDISGATVSVYSISSAMRSDSGAAFRCIVSNAVGRDTSNVAFLHVMPIPPAITAQPVARTVNAGQTATFAVTVAGTAPLYYQWQKNNADISGAKDSAYTTPAATAADSGALFQCIVYNLAGKDTSSQARLTVISTYPAVVTNDPHDTTVAETHAATFNVVAAGTVPITYRWQKDGTNISGATAASYTFTSPAFADSGAAIRCIVSNVAGMDTSLAAVLRVSPSAPTITTQPGNQTVIVGYTATFDVAASGTTTLTYQWQKNGASIAGATSASYTTPSASLTDNGATFRCIVTNRGGMATSQAAVLNVNSAPVVPNAATNGTFESGTTGWTVYSNGAASYAVSSPGSSGSGQAALVTVTTEGTNVQLYQTGITLQANTSYQLSFDAYSNTGHDVDVSLEQHTSPYTNYGLANKLFNLTTAWQTFTVTFTTSGFSGSVNDTRLMFWLAPYDAAGDKFYFDNVQLAKTSDLAPTAPTITVQPVAQTVTAGQTATFSVTATGTAPLSYQWQRNIIDISGATSASYTTAAVTRTDSGALYRCKVANIATSVFSSAAQLQVITPQPPLVTLEPRDTTVQEGRPASFAISATGSTPLSYQWQQNGAAISGAISASYSITSSARSDSGAAFRCVVSNSVGKDTSMAARLSVLAIPPAIATQPSNQSVTAGLTATFTITATGSATLSYQWQKNTVDITGATAASYITPAATAADSGALFRCHVANSTGSVFSNSAQLLVVTPQPAVVTLEPHDTTVTEGGAASFTLTAGGTTPLTYQWQKNGSNISGAITASYSITAAVRSDSGAGFRCIVSNLAGKDTSVRALLRVLAVPPAITSQPVAQTVTAGLTATFTVTASGSTPLSYQWQKNSSPISGATGASYTTPATVAADSGSIYRCVVTNTAGSVASQAALLSVNKIPPVIPNAVANGTFESGTTSWTVYSNGAASYAVSSPGSSGSGQAALVTVTTEGTNVQLYQTGITLQANTSYQLSFDAYSNTGHDVDVSLEQHTSPYANYGLANKLFNLTTAWQTFTVTFTTSGFSGSVNDTRLMFWLAPYDAAGDKFYFDNVQLAKTSDLAPTAPTITVQPVAQTVTAGQTATFSVTATGTAPLSYQWQRNIIDISGATSASYTTAALTAADSGALLRCRVSNTAGSATSTPALLSVVTPQPPVVTLDPRDTTVSEGSAASFTVITSGSTPLSYQWQKNSSNIIGATTASYSIASAVRSDSGAAFRCIATNSVGKDTSTAALLRVLAVPPVVTAQPANQAVTVGQTATFTVAATGTAPLSYQWQKNGSSVTGATSATYTSPATVTSDSGASYRCQITNPAGSVMSQAAVLIVSKTISNLLANGTFESGITGWAFYTDGAGSYAAGSPGSSGAGNAMQISISTEGTNVQFYQAGITLQANTSYQLSFDAYSNTGHDVDVSLEQHTSPYTNYGLANKLFNLTTAWQTFTVTFTTSGFSGSVNDTRLMFWLAPYDAASDRYYFDNVVLWTAPLAKESPQEDPSTSSLASIIPGDFVLEGNFPNPFNPSTMIRYGLPEPAIVSIVVYNILGQEVARLGDGYQPAGTFQVSWDGRGNSAGTVSSGIYLCRMVATAGSGKSFAATKRMILMK